MFEPGGENFFFIFFIFFYNFSFQVREGTKMIFFDPTRKFDPGDEKFFYFFL